MSSVHGWAMQHVLGSFETAGVVQLDAAKVQTSDFEFNARAVC